ncbi:MAG: hypothetical protein II311_07980 [Lachnospiraceae bacterium]|nr:hypothetical protein [Lachnospiraceae bacterium]
MELVYRGYPQKYEKEPYRIYNRDVQQTLPEEWDERRRTQAEYEYARGLYPLNMKNWQRFVEEEFDREDGPNSAIYDEWPDREWLYGMRSRILNNAGEQGRVTNEDAVMIMILHEMLRRRGRNNMPLRRQ